MKKQPGESCPFCLWEISGENRFEELSAHLEDCSGRRGYFDNAPASPIRLVETFDPDASRRSKIALDHGGLPAMPESCDHCLTVLERDALIHECVHVRELIGSALAQHSALRQPVNSDFVTAYELLVGLFPSSEETVARGDSDVPEACTDSSHDLAEWVLATIDYLLLDEGRPESLGLYVSKPTLARKAKDKVRELARRAA